MINRLPVHPLVIAIGHIVIDTPTPLPIVVLDEGRLLPRLKIPERFRAGIAAFSALPDDTFMELLQAIEGNIVADTPEDAATGLAAKFPSIPNGDLAKILAAIASLQSLDTRAHVPTAVLSADVTESLTQDSPELAKSLDKETVKKRVQASVTAKNITITSSRITELTTEVERMYCRSRILTDVRTAFSDDASELPRGMTLLHNLQIGYHDDLGRHREFYVTLDSDDLEELKESIERALKKGGTLKQLLAKADCKLFE